MRKEVQNESQNNWAEKISLSLKKQHYIIKRNLKQTKAGFGYDNSVSLQTEDAAHVAYVVSLQTNDVRHNWKGL